MLWLRSLLSIALLPFTVAVLVPWWIARANGIDLALGNGALAEALQALGVGLLLVGLGLFAPSVLRFAVDGRGTLAPWDPPRTLVVRGPYRYVRNPIISGVVFALAGGSLVLLSWPHAVWAAIFLAANLVWIPLVEEPELAERFGAAYDEYCRHVPRVLPRLRPWTPDRDGG